MKTLLTFVNDNDSEGFYKMAGVDSRSIVKKCWWNNKEVNCSNIFLNHQSDDNVCFTFNQHPKYIDYNKGGLG